MNENWFYLLTCLSVSSLKSSSLSISRPKNICIAICFSKIKHNYHYLFKWLSSIIYYYAPSNLCLCVCVVLWEQRLDSHIFTHHHVISFSYEYSNRFSLCILFYTIVFIYESTTVLSFGWCRKKIRLIFLKHLLSRVVVVQWYFCSFLMMSSSFV